MESIVPADARKRFESGDIESVLLGLRGYLLHTKTTYSRHDTGLALRYLMSWSKEGNFEAASRLLYELLYRLAETGELASMVEIFRCYYIYVTMSGSEDLDMDWKKLAFIARHCHARYGPDHYDDPETLMGMVEVERLFCKHGQ